LQINFKYKNILAKNQILITIKIFKNMKKLIFCILKITEDFGTDPHLDPLVRRKDPRIRIRACYNIPAAASYEAGQFIDNGVHQTIAAGNVVIGRFFFRWLPQLLLVLLSFSCHSSAEIILKYKPDPL
jgi:hypothetical protein